MARDSNTIHKVILFSAILALFFSFTPNMEQTAFADDDKEHSQHIKNGSFEVPKVKKGKWSAFPESNQLKWDVEWRDGSCSGHPDALLEIQNNVKGLGGAKHKRQHAELDSHCPTIISQKINTHEDRKYVLEFYSKQRPNTPDNTNGLRVLVNGDEVINISDMSKNWKKSKHEFKGTGGFVTIAFEDTGISDSLGTFLDKVSVKSKEIDDDDILKWVVKVLRQIMTGEIEWVHWDSIKDETIPDGLADGDDDTLGSLSCAPGDIVKLDGTNTWVCDTDLDTLGSLSCADSEIAVFDQPNNMWKCGTGGGGGDDLGNHIATQNLDMANNDLDNVGTIDADTYDFDGTSNFVCTDTSGCMPGTIVSQFSVGGDRIATDAIGPRELHPSAVQFGMYVKTVPLPGAVIEGGDFDTFTASCDNPSDLITGFEVASVDNDVSPYGFISITPDSATSPNELSLNIVNYGEEDIEGIDIVLFCATFSAGVNP